MRGEGNRSLPLPVVSLPSDIGQFDGADALCNGAEGRARPDRLKLLMVANEYQLGATLFGLCNEARQLTACHHPRFIDDENVVASKLVSALAPAIFPGGKRSGRNPR